MDPRFAQLECSVAIGDATEFQRIDPNDATFKIDMPWFEGDGLLLLRTPEAPDADKFQKTVFGGGRRRMFELQISGRFKWPFVPGPLFVGGELTSPTMRLSGPARLAARGTLAFVRAAAGAGTLSYSFGDPGLHVAPHIVAPMLSSMPALWYDGDFEDGVDWQLGEPSTKEAKSERAKRKGDAEAAFAKAQSERRDSVVTMSLNSAVVDARLWTAKLPGLPGLDLHRVWDDADLLISFYALDANALTQNHQNTNGHQPTKKNGSSSSSSSNNAKTVRYADYDGVPHAAESKRYMVRVKLRHDPVRPVAEKTAGTTTAARQADEAARSPLKEEEEVSHSMAPQGLMLDDEDDDDEDDEDDDDDESARFFFDAKDEEEYRRDDSYATAQSTAHSHQPSPPPPSQLVLLRRDASSCAGSIRGGAGEGTAPLFCGALFQGGTSTTTTGFGKGGRARRYATPGRMQGLVARALVSATTTTQDGGPRRVVGEEADPHCRAWVSIVDSFDGRRRDYYAVGWKGKLHLRRRRGKTLASPKDVVRAYPRDEGRAWSKRLNVRERRRRRFSATARALATIDGLQEWLGASSSADAHFLSRRKLSSSGFGSRKNNNTRHTTTSAAAASSRFHFMHIGFGIRRNNANSINGGPVARAATARSWREEWLALERRGSERVLVFSDREGSARLFEVVVSDGDVFFGAKPVNDERSSSSSSKCGSERVSPFVGLDAFAAFDLVTCDRVTRVACIDAADRDDWLRRIADATAIITAADDDDDNNKDGDDDESAMRNDRKNAAATSSSKTDNNTTDSNEKGTIACEDEEDEDEEQHNSRPGLFFGLFSRKRTTKKPRFGLLGEYMFESDEEEEPASPSSGEEDAAPKRRRRARARDKTASREKKRVDRLSRGLRVALATPGDEWAPAGRWILNARTQFCVVDDTGENADGVQSPDDEEEEDPVALAERLVKTAHELGHLSCATSPVEWRERWPRFVDDAGKLRRVNLKKGGVPLQGSRGLAFWLNVYHALLAHAHLVFGVPRRAKDFARHFAASCYVVDGDIVSLAEIEHRVVRGGVAGLGAAPPGPPGGTYQPPPAFATKSPRLLLSDILRFSSRLRDVALLRAALATRGKFATPYAFALRDAGRHPRARLVFGLNPGSESTPPTVRVYRPATLDAQLDAAVRDALLYSSSDDGASSSATTTTTTTPARPRWGEDLASSQADSSHVVEQHHQYPLSVPRLVAWHHLEWDQDLAPYYLRGADAAAPSRHQNAAKNGGGALGGGSSSLTYRPFSFTCRFLRLIDD